MNYFSLVSYIVFATLCLPLHGAPRKKSGRKYNRVAKLEARIQQLEKRIKNSEGLTQNDTDNGNGQDTREAEDAVDEQQGVGVAQGPAATSSEMPPQNTEEIETINKRDLRTESNLSDEQKRALSSKSPTGGGTTGSDTADAA